MVSWLLDWASKTNRRPVVLTRGYHASPPLLPFHVHENSLPDQAGDEPLMLAKNHPGADILVDPKRIRSAPWAEDTLHPDLLILDDGFQHLAVQRHIDLVLLSPADLTEAWNKVIPSGSWREGTKALKRAHVFIVNTTGSSIDSLYPQAIKHLGPLHKPIYFVELIPMHVRNLSSGHLSEHLDKEPYVLFTGIANPKRVIRTATELLGTPPADHLFFPDHHAFTPEDLTLIRQRSQECGAKHMVCTPKDGIKISASPQDQIWQIETRLHFTARQHTSRWLPEYLEEKIRNV